MGFNYYPHPRGAKVKSLLTNRLHEEFVRKKNEFTNRGSATLQDGYSAREFEAIVRGCWIIVEGKSALISLTIEAYFRTALDFLLSHNMLLRGENRRGAELADLFALPLANEGPTSCTALMLLLGNGKTNYLGKVEYGVTVRHRNPFCCTLAHLAFYMFYRWDCVREPPPRFQRRSQWYRIHLIKGQTLDVGISYGVQLDWTNRIFKNAHVKSLKKTHAVRSRGAQYAELAGVTESQIRRAGRWNNDALTNCYLSNIPLEFVRSMAGFPPAQPGNYFLPRTKVTPPENLIRAVWPWVDQWQTWFQEKHGEIAPQSSASYDKIDLDNAGEQPEDLAAQGFLRLLAELRIILLQDSVLFGREFPQHPLWLQPLFVRSDYQAFAQDILRSLDYIEEPAELRLRTMAPDIANQINLSRTDILQTIELQGSRTNSLVQDIRRQIDMRIDTFANGSSTFQPGVPRPPSLLGQTEAPTRPPFVPLRTDETAPLSASFVLDPNVVHPYAMCRSLVSVADLWREWYTGLLGSPSIQALETAYGAKWRTSSGEKMFFGRRKIIIDEIQRRLQTGESPEAAIEHLDLVRQRERLILHGLAAWLKRENIVRSQIKGKGKAKR